MLEMRCLLLHLMLLFFCCCFSDKSGLDPFPKPSVSSAIETFPEGTILSAIWPAFTTRHGLPASPVQAASTGKITSSLTYSTCMVNHSWVHTVTTSEPVQLEHSHHVSPSGSVTVLCSTSTWSLQIMIMTNQFNQFKCFIETICSTALHVYVLVLKSIINDYYYIPNLYWFICMNLFYSMKPSLNQVNK